MSDKGQKVPHLPPRLQARMRQYEFELPPFAAVYDRILVYPLDTVDQPDSTAGGIILPEQAKKNLGAQRGVIISAGAKAMEELFSHGIMLGDIVYFARFSHWERPYYGPSKKRPYRVCVVQAAEVVASEDLKAHFDSGELSMVMMDDGKFELSDRERIDPPMMDLGEGA